jgi:hypothetical protein
LDSIASQGLLEVGGGPWQPWSLREYDSARYGPLLGVSDDGGAANQIVRAFTDSPKSKVLRCRGELSLETIGGCVDAERISAAGELLVGPAEFAAVREAVIGRVPMTTNVGTVVLPRFYRAAPSVTVRADATAGELPQAIADLKAAFAPYRANPTGGPGRSVTAYVAFRSRDRIRTRRKVEILRELDRAVRDGATGDPVGFSIGLLQRAKDRGSAAPQYAIDLVAQAGLTKVLIEGAPRWESQDQLMFPGLLSFFSSRRVNEILAYAADKGVTIEPKNRIDPETAARTIWAGLVAARTMGAQLGKFGLFPLPFEQQSAVVGAVQGMLPGWTATPAFYVDRPLVTSTRVFEERALVDPIVRWIEAVSAAGANIVLLDAPDRTPHPAGTSQLPYQMDRGRRLLKRDDPSGRADRVGVLTAEDVDTISAAAKALHEPVRIMWAGGIDGRQAYDLARRGEFGIFTTSTTARRVAVRGGGDPSLAARLEPTYLGVLGVRMVVEAGFLAGVAAAEGDARMAGEIDRTAEPVLAALESGLLVTADDDDRIPSLDALADILEPVWSRHLARPS